MSKIIQFKITIQGSKPPIWRRIQVTDDYRLDRFHQVIQIAMGWWNSHLHEFRIGGRSFGMILPYDDFNEAEDETKVYLRELDLKKGDKMLYTYDFGDNWEHLLEVEKTEEAELLLPVCLTGKRHCPPEDCGGIWGYQDLLEVIKDPKDPDYEDMKEWLPEDFDPAFFDLESTNAELEEFGKWHRKHPRAKSTPWHQI